MDDRVGWKSGPDTRGTLEILWSAFVTLALCVWTAVHPNIEIKDKFGHNLGARLLMMLIATIFPEALISAAWDQRSTADRLVNYIARQNVQDKEAISYQGRFSGGEKTLSDHEWSRKQAFYVVMGGFAFEHTYKDVFGRTRVERTILTVQGFELMKRVGYSPRLTKQDVEERSNADIIAKVFVVCQVIWFAVQVITRVATGLAVTALEVHTVVHVGCAMLMYFLWWDKPYAISRPTLLSEQSSADIGALFLFNNILHQRHEKAVRDHEILRSQYWERRALAMNHNLIEHDPPPENPQKPTITQALTTYTSQEFESQNAEGFEALLRSTAEDAYEGLQHILSQDTEALFVLEQPNWRGVRQHSENFTLREVWGSWTVDSGHEMSLSKVIHFVFNLLYGGGHLAAWNSSTFPTNFERLLWQVSSIFVAILFSYGTLWVLFWRAARSRSKWLLPVRRGEINILVGPFFCGIILAYVGARCYFLIESLISLRSLPSSAYTAVRWSSYLPHSS